MPEVVREKYDILIFAAANQLNPAFDLASLADRLEKCQKPMIVVGLGAQAPDFLTKVELSQGTKRLLSIFSERCKTIGMRGEFSARVAKDNGANNVVVIGCPSNFINAKERQLGQLIEKRLRLANRPYRPAVNLDFSAHLKPILTRCVQWLIEWEGVLIVQSPLTLIQASLHQMQDIPDREMNAYSRHLLDRDYDDEARRFFLAKLFSFFDVEAWMTFLRGCSFSLGTRLHGNVLAMQAGVPCFIIPHDFSHSRAS